MKYSVTTLFLFLGIPFLLNGQPVVFTDHSDLLNPIAGFATYSDCVVDMNGDFLDDIVRVGEKGVFIDYQKPDSIFFQRQFNFPVQSPPSWSICAGDLDRNHLNDLLFAHSSSVSFVKAIEHGNGYKEELMPGEVESQRSTIADINNDGWLDAFVCHESGESVPYRNLGNGVMIPDSSLIETSDLVGNYAAIWTDYDNDGDIDLYISKCWESALPGDPVRTNLLYRNNSDGTFTEIAAQARLDDNAQTWSTAFEDFDNDGDFDAFIMNHDFANRLMRNNGDGTFTDVIHGSGIDSLDLVGYETQSGDFNNDGYIDLFTDLSFGLYLGNGDLTFVGQEIPMKPGGIGDLNNDGALDVVQDNTLWLNTNNENHWVKINTLGLISNPNGIGARVEIYGGWGMQIREVRSGQGYSPMNSLTTHFGTGEHDHIDSLVVRWPSGIVTRLKDLDIDTTYHIPETNCLDQSIALDVNGPIQLCPWESISIPGPEGYASYLWSNGDTTQYSILDTAGFYYLVVVDSTDCMSLSQLIEVVKIEDIKPVITTSAGLRFCEGDTLILTSSPGENYRWSTGQILQQSIGVTESGGYTVAIDAKCFVGQISSDTIFVTSLPSSSPVASNVYLFPGDSVLLTAIGENIHWYDQLVGGNLLATGPSYQTSELDASTTYFIESHHLYPAELQSGGKQDTTGIGGLPEQNGHLIFEVWEPFVLNSVSVYIPAGGPQGVRFVQLISGDSVLASKSFSVVEGLNILELDFDVPVGKFMLTSPQGNLFRNAGLLEYPYPIGNVGQITRSSNGENYYYYFYDWKITKPAMECISERVPFNVIVTSVNAYNDDAAFIIYPNPAHQSLKVKAHEDLFPLNLTIINSLGQKIVHSILLTNDSNHNLEDIMPGNYFIQIQNKEKVINRKLIIQ